ncbi:hypothetical protein Hanom_Chr11g01044831 [Helianthus anomalus]
MTLRVVVAPLQSFLHLHRRTSIVTPSPPSHSHHSSTSAQPPLAHLFWLIEGKEAVFKLSRRLKVLNPFFKEIRDVKDAVPNESF